LRIGRKKSSKLAILSRRSLAVATVRWNANVCSCVTALDCCCKAYCPRRISIDVLIESTCVSKSFARSCWNGRLLSWAALCALIWNGIDVWSSGVPSGRVIDCTCAMPSVWKTAFATRSNRIMSVGLRRSWSVSTISSSGLSRAFEK
jgi:hypothetical protein